MPVGEIGGVDDDEDVIVGAVALHRMRFIHPGAPGIGAEQDDLLDVAAFLEVGACAIERIGKLLLNDLDGAGEFTLFLLREMFEARLHEPSIGERGGDVYSHN